MSPRKHANTYMVKGPVRGARTPHLKKLVGAVLAGGLLFSSGLGRAQEKPTSPPASDPIFDPRILQVKRVCIEKLGEDVLGKQVQEIVIAKLFEAKRFSLTENCERADFTLKGSVTQRSDHAFRSESEGVSAGNAEVGAAASSGSAVVVGAGASVSGHESLSSSETKEHAVVTLRLTNREGDILWAISQESTGGKTKGAIGDAAERAVRRLLRDIERADKQSEKKESVKQP